MVNKSHVIIYILVVVAMSKYTKVLHGWTLDGILIIKTQFPVF